MERLDKIIASQGKYTRKEIKKLIANGRVSVDGNTAKDFGMKINVNNSTIAVEGKILNFRRHVHVYLMLNKPKGYTSIVEGNHHDMIMELIPPELFREGLLPAGRLERDSSGLMIITDDEELAHNILSPRKLVRKIYEIELNTAITQQMVDKFANGIKIGNDEIKSATIEITGEKTCYVTTLDGRYFQIKQMFEKCDAVVTELHRICIGNLFLPEDLEIGECREMTIEEVNLLSEKN